MFQPGNQAALKVTDAEVSDALWECGGRITDAAKKLNINPDTIYDRKSKNPELEEVLIKARRQTKSLLDDACIKGIHYRLSRMKEEPRVSLDTIKYWLDNNGEEWGFNKKSVADSPNEKRITDEHELVKKEYQIQKLKELLLKNGIQPETSSELLRSDETP
jgi:hypothetical protein